LAKKLKNRNCKRGVKARAHVMQHGRGLGKEEAGSERKGGSTNGGHHRQDLRGEEGKSTITAPAVTNLRANM